MLTNKNLDYMDSIRVLFLSRKYPPQKGGMESYSYNLITNFKGRYTAKTLGRKQINLLWFYPYCLVYTLFHLKCFDVIELGDMLLCGIGWIAKKIRPSIKVVVTVHGLDITYKNFLYQFYLRCFSYGFDMYVPNSSYTKQIAEKRNYHPCTVIEPATLDTQHKNSTPTCDKETFRKKYSIPQDSYVILTVGRLVERKGVEWFIKNVMPQLRNKNIYYLVAGTGEMEKKIRETIAEVNEKRVKLLGYISDDELDNLYYNADIFLMPNIWVQGDVEGFGMVAVEAAARGCLVIAADIQGIKDAVKNNISGILYKAESAIELQILLSDILDNFDAYEKIRHSSIKYVLNKYTGEAVARRYSKLFEQVVNKERKTNESSFLSGS